MRRVNWVGLGVSAAVVLVGLVAIEVFARAFLPQWAPPSADRTFWAYDEKLGWVHVPGSSGPMVHRDFSVTVSHNSLGLRDREYPIERSPGKKRMLVLGSSFSWGYGVEREEIYMELLESRYPNWEIINASVSGYGTDQELLYLREWGPKLRPDVVLLALHYNDVVGNLSGSRYWHNKPFFERGPDGELVLRNQPVPPVGLKERIQKYVFSETYFFSKLDIRLRRATKQGGKAVRSTAGFDLTRDLVMQIDATCRELGAQLVIMLARTGRDDWLEFIDGELDAAEIPHFGLLEAFENPSERLQYEHDQHWNPAGHRVVSRVFEDFLLEQGILP